VKVFDRTYDIIKALPTYLSMYYNKKDRYYLNPGDRRLRVVFV